MITTLQIKATKRIAEMTPSSTRIKLLDRDRVEVSGPRRRVTMPARDWLDADAATVLAWIAPCLSATMPRSIL